MSTGSGLGLTIVSVACSFWIVAFVGSERLTVKLRDGKYSGSAATMSVMSCTWSWMGKLTVPEAAV